MRRLVTAFILVFGFLSCAHAGAWLYRFNLGFGPVSLGSEALNYVDYRSPYAALTHSYYAEWSAKGRALKFRLKDGTSRAPLGNAGVQKNDYAVLEIEWQF